jgi:hypothetical protein
LLSTGRRRIEKGSKRDAVNLNINSIVDEVVIPTALPPMAAKR